MSLGKPLPRWSRRGHLNTICMLFFPLVWAVLSCSVRPFPSPPRLLCPWGCSRLEYWSGLPCPPPRDLPNQGSNPASHIADGFFNICATREAHEYWYGQPIPSPGYLPDLEIGLGSPALQVDFFYQLSYQGRPNFCHFFRNFFFFSFCGQEEGKILVWGLLWHQRFIAVDLMGSVGFRQVSRTEASLQHQQYS